MMNPETPKLLERFFSNRWSLTNDELATLDADYGEILLHGKGKPRDFDTLLATHNRAKGKGDDIHQVKAAIKSHLDTHRPLSELSQAELAELSHTGKMPAAPVSNPELHQMSQNELAKLIFK